VTGPWYKVLVGDQSCTAGSMTWSLPRDGQPGEWHEVPAPIERCRTGLHLTQDPAQWWKDGCTVYLAEGEEPDGQPMDAGSKVAFRRARLIRELTGDELAALWIFTGTRKGEVPAGKHGIALGSSSVVAWGSSRVVARESSSVVAWGSSRVEARESSSVEARESSSVEGSGSSIVARPAPSCGCSQCANKSTVTAAERCVVVDQTGDAPAVRVAAGELTLAEESKAKKPRKRAVKKGGVK